MIFQRTLLLVLFNLFATSVDSFSISQPSILSSIQSSKTSTCLRAEEESETETTDDEVVSGGDSADAASDILNSPAFLTRKLEVLKSDIEKIDEEIAETQQQVEAGKAEWGPQLEDLQREYTNIQERMSSQNSKGDTMATQQVVREVLEVIDNFDRAFGAIVPETEEEVVIEAEYKALYQKIIDTFDSLGVKKVETVGTEFNYEYHQAVMQRPSPDYEEGIVCDELQSGFMVGDTLIRAAMVAVAA